MIGFFDIWNFLGINLRETKFKKEKKTKNFSKEVIINENFSNNIYPIEKKFEGKVKIKNESKLENIISKFENENLDSNFSVKSLKSDLDYILNPNLGEFAYRIGSKFSKEYSIKDRLLALTKIYENVGFLIDDNYRKKINDFLEKQSKKYSKIDENKTSYQNQTAKNYLEFKKIFEIENTKVDKNLVEFLNESDKKDQNEIDNFLRNYLTKENLKNENNIKYTLFFFEDKKEEKFYRGIHFVFNNALNDKKFKKSA